MLRETMLRFVLPIEKVTSRTYGPARRDTWLSLSGLFL
jgi:hypothetical protein